jgi:hypothetical protein
MWWVLDLAGLYFLLRSCPVDRQAQARARSERGFFAELLGGEYLVDRQNGKYSREEWLMTTALMNVR